jgi:hypothetical protein
MAANEQNHAGGRYGTVPSESALKRLVTVDSTWRSHKPRRAVDEP